jgi:hypothetical protein
MTFAEMLLLIAGVTVIYVLLRPLQRWIERHLMRRIAPRHPYSRRPMIDVTGFRSHDARRKEDDHA